MAPRRKRERAEEAETSVVTGSSKSPSEVYETNNGSSSSSRKYKCKTCNREFSKFQALGGHRASHKKPAKLTENGQEYDLSESKMHECSICGAGFFIGQALGGHMRKHQEVLREAKTNSTRIKQRVAHEVLPCDKAKKTKHEKVRRSGREIVNLDLDLNLTPSQNGLEHNNGKNHHIQE